MQDNLQNFNENQLNLILSSSNTVGHTLDIDNGDYVRMSVFNENNPTNPYLIDGKDAIYYTNRNIVDNNAGVVIENGTLSNPEIKLYQRQDNDIKVFL